MIGNGWLRESQVVVWPRAWEIRSRSALRKCMFLPAHPGWQHQAAAVSPAAMPRPLPQRVPPPIVPYRHDPKKDVRMFAAVSPNVIPERRAPRVDERPRVLAAAPPSTAWYDDPVAMGSLLIVCPPIGLAALWSSKRYSLDARWALTIMTALMMCLCAGIVVAVIALRG